MVAIINTVHIVFLVGIWSTRCKLKIIYLEFKSTEICFLRMDVLSQTTENITVLNTWLYLLNRTIEKELSNSDGQLFQKLIQKTQDHYMLCDTKDGFKSLKCKEEEMFYFQNILFTRAVSRNVHLEGYCTHYILLEHLIRL